jgi:hypothetical protein
MDDFSINLEAFSEALKNMTHEDFDKYFPQDNTPDGWVSIEVTNGYNGRFC